MKYDIAKPSVTKLPTLGKGTECIKISSHRPRKTCTNPSFRCFPPPLGAHVSGSEFLYPDLTWKETCGQMANLVADSGGNKGQFSLLVEAVCRDSL